MSRTDYSGRLLLWPTVSFLAFVIHANVASAQLDPSILKRIKDSTVLIKTNFGGTGSGFVVWSHGIDSYVATNAHVVEKHAPATAPAHVACVFNSGQPNEVTRQGHLYAYSQVDDLALLKIINLKNPPMIEAKAGIVPSETQRVYAAGFPFGEMLSIGDRNPNLTVTETGITSVRLRESGMPETLQTSGGIDPGNSGGPVIDTEGRLVGISVAKIKESSIGFAIPAWKLAEMLPVAMTDILMTKRSNEPGFRFRVNLSGDKFSNGPHPMLMGGRFAKGRKVSSELRANSWTEIPGLKQLSYSSLPSETPLNFRQIVALVQLDQMKFQEDDDQYVFQWRLPLKFNRETNSQPFRYSRPLFVSRKDVEASENSRGKTATLSPSSPSSPGQVSPKTDGVVHKFDSVIYRCIPAGGGRYLVLQLSNDDIVVVDVKTKKQIAKTSDAAADSIVAGKSSVIAFNRADRTMTTYRLPNLEPEGTKPIRDKPIVRIADWGANATGPIAAVVQPSGAKNLACVLIDPKTARVSKIPLTVERRSRAKNTPSFLEAMPTNGNFDLRMNDEGNMITMWLRNTNRPQVHVIQKGRRSWEHSFFSDGAAYGYASPTGKLIFSAASVLGNDLGLIHESALCMPTLSDDYFLTLSAVELADTSNGYSGPRTTTDPKVKHVSRFVWSVASASESKIHRSLVFDADLNNEVIAMGMRMDERFVCIPQYDTFTAILPEGLRGKSTRLRLLDLGERLDGVKDPDEPTTSEQETTAKPSAVRTWTDITGQHKIEASVVAVKQGYVKLKRKDGSTVVLPLSKLSAPDQVILRRLEE